jgi:cell division protein FtsQ
VFVASQTVKRPRGAQRKSAVSGAKSHSLTPFRRWLNRSLLIFGTALVSAGLYRGALAVGGHQVEILSILGNVTHIDPQAIQLRLAPRITAGFFSADLGDLRRELESLPWVYQVNTRKRWPAEIEVHLVEQRPLARWGDKGYLNHEAQFFQVAHEAMYEHLPLLSGPDGTQADLMRRYQVLADMLEPDGLAVHAISLDELGQVFVDVDKGPQLVLGASDMAQRIRRFRQIWKLAPMGTAIARVDLRYEHGAAVSFSDTKLVVRSTDDGRQG